MPLHSSRRSAGFSAVWVALLTAQFVAPISVASAEPFLTELEWIHPDPEQVLGFRVLFALEPGEREDPKVIDVGKPAREDRFVWSISVPEDSSVWVAVVALGRSGSVSPASEWRRYDWRSGQGPLRSPGRPYLVQEGAR